LFVESWLLQKFEQTLKFNQGDRFFDEKSPKTDGFLHILDKIQFFIVKTNFLLSRNLENLKF
jgi:hypothetical protein